MSGNIDIMPTILDLAGGLGMIPGCGITSCLAVNSLLALAKEREVTDSSSRRAVALEG